MRLNEPNAGPTELAGERLPRRMDDDRPSELVHERDDPLPPALRRLGPEPERPLRLAERAQVVATSSPHLAPV